MEKTTLLELITSNHTCFEQLVTQVGQEKMMTPLIEDGKTGKDIVAHVATWQRRLNNWFQIARQGSIPHSPESGTTWNNMDRLNAETLQRDKDRSLDDVLTDFQQSFQGFLTLVQSFSDEELQASYPFAWGGLHAGEEERPLWVSVLAGPGYAHYQDHIFDLLRRIEPEKHYKPRSEALQTYTGAYTHPDKSPFSFSIQDENLLLHTESETFSCLVLDETRFAFQDVGLVTFYPALDGTVPTMEWWAWHFTRAQNVFPASRVEK